MEPHLNLAFARLEAEPCTCPAVTDPKRSSVLSSPEQKHRNRNTGTEHNPAPMVHIVTLSSKIHHKASHNRNESTTSQKGLEHLTHTVASGSRNALWRLGFYCGICERSATTAKGLRPPAMEQEQLAHGYWLAGEPWEWVTRVGNPEKQK